MNGSRHLWTIAGEVQAVIARYLEEREGKRFYGKFKRIDMLRLTKLRVWSWRYKVGIEEILILTLPYLRKSLSTQQKARYGLGCSVAALTGAGNEKILVEALRQKYPGNEHQDAWRERERRKQLEAEEIEETDGLQVRARQARGMLESDSVKHYIESYRRRVLGMRRKMNQQLGSARRKRKHYRGNPWL